MSASKQFCPDTNVLLRLQDVDALDIISSLINCELILTDIVWDEATRKPGVGAAAKRILSGIGHVVKRDFIPNEPDTLMFEKLRNQYPESNYQDGELSVTPCAYGTLVLQRASRATRSSKGSARRPGFGSACEVLSDPDLARAFASVAKNCCSLPYDCVHHWTAPAPSTDPDPT